MVPTEISFLHLIPDYNDLVMARTMFTDLASMKRLCLYRPSRLRVVPVNTVPRPSLPLCSALVRLICMEGPLETSHRLQLLPRLSTMRVGPSICRTSCRRLPGRVHTTAPSISPCTLLPKRSQVPTLERSIARIWYSRSCCQVDRVFWRPVLLPPPVRSVGPMFCESPLLP